MLAEPRYKQKWTEDPRNLNWSKDTNKYGYRMLSKMGWSEGKGLGANENGTVSHVKVSKRKDNLGLGGSSFHDDNWLAHHDEFSALLTKLNQGGGKGDKEKEQKSLEETVQQSQRKILYTKFIKSKDLSLKSKNDLACIFGQRSKSTPATPQNISEDEGANSDTSTASCPVSGKKPEDSEQGFVTVKSEMNLKEYFAQRMAALKTKNQTKRMEESSEVKNNVIFDIAEEEREKKKKKKKKRKREELEELQKDIECDEKNVAIESTITGDSVAMSLRKKNKSKKHKISDVNEIEHGQHGGSQDISNKRKKKKKRSEGRCEQTNVRNVNEKCSSKTWFVEVENEEENEEEVVQKTEKEFTGASSKKAKKKKKRKREETEKVQEDNELPKKKRK